MARVTLHDRKLKAVRDALEELFADTSVDARKTLEGLNDLLAEIEIKAGAIKTDLRRGGN